jgi:hypothetical protein
MPDDREIAQVWNFDVDEIAVSLDQPAQVALDAGTRKIVEQSHLMPG